MKTETDFETSLQELETHVAALERGDLGLDDALDRYTRGVQVLARCHQLLDTAERQVALLTGVDADGQPITRPLDAQEGDGTSD